MHESNEIQPTKESLRTDLYQKAETLSEDSRAKFDYPGIKQSVLDNLRKEEATLPEGFFTPIDEIVKKCEEQGIRVYTTEDPRNHEVFIIPAVNAFAQEDSLRLHYFDPNAIDDGELSKLVAIACELADIKRSGMN